MIIKLAPYAPLLEINNILEVQINNEELTINGEIFDFSVIPDGATLPASAIACDFITNDVERVNGVLRITLRLPLSNSPSQDACFPVDIVNPPNGALELPQ